MPYFRTSSRRSNRSPRRQLNADQIASQNFLARRSSRSLDDWKRDQDEDDKLKTASEKAKQAAANVEPDDGQAAASLAPAKVLS